MAKSRPRQTPANDSLIASPRGGGKHAAGVLSRCRLWWPASYAAARPGQEDRNKRQYQEGRRHVAGAVMEIHTIQETANRRADRLPDVKHGGVERDGGRGHLWRGGHQPHLLHRVGGRK